MHVGSTRIDSFVLIDVTIELHFLQTIRQRAKSVLLDCFRALFEFCNCPSEFELINSLRMTATSSLGSQENTENEILAFKRVGEIAKPFGCSGEPYE
mmetsp:Transcript_5714/g.6199  ORF Transcript_5714/g.6199 Transcript_5714/m.6199 type:complete len:97 (+) Transcript_5714:1552-1842(+)